MKKIVFLLFVFAFLGMFSQSVPPIINYQGVVRDANGDPVLSNVSVRLNLSTTPNVGGAVYQETYNNIPTVQGLFSLKFGSTNGGIPTNLSWGTQNYFLVVEVDATGGNNFILLGSQQLVSVPMALYAEKAGNSVTYTAGTNVSINNGTISSTPSLALAGNTLSISGGNVVILPGSSQGTLTASPNATVTSAGTNSFNIDIPNYVAGTNVTITPGAGNTYSISAGTGSVIPTTFFTVNAPHTSTTVTNSTSLNIISPNISITGGGGSVTTNVLPNYILNIPSVAISPTAGGINVVQGGLVSYTVPLSTGPWAITGGSIYPATLSNHVGIGTNSPASKLEVLAPPGSSMNGANITSQNGIGVFGVSNSTLVSNAGVYGSNTASGYGVLGATSSSVTSISAVKGQNTGAGVGVYGENAYAVNSPSAHGVYGRTSNPSNFVAGVKGENSVVNAGPGIWGVTTSSFSPGVYGENNGEGDGIYGRTNSMNPGLNTAGVHGNHYGNGYGVWGISSGTANYSGVWGNNTGNGTGVMGTTNSSVTLAAGVYGYNSGTGPGVKASLSTGTVAGSINAALLVEYGHIKTAGATPSMGSYTFSGLPGASIGFGGGINGNDIRGTVSFYTPNGFTTVNQGGYVEQEVLFAKTYNTAPTVVISPQNDLLGMQFMTTNVGTSGFRIRIYRTSNALVGFPTSITTNYLMSFSYHVIE